VLAIPAAEELNFALVTSESNLKFPDSRLFTSIYVPCRQSWSSCQILVVKTNEIVINRLFLLGNYYYLKGKRIFEQEPSIRSEIKRSLFNHNLEDFIINSSKSRLPKQRILIQPGSSSIRPTQTAHRILVLVTIVGEPPRLL
jgi:hypothetical protein